MARRENLEIDSSKRGRSRTVQLDTELRSLGVRRINRAACNLRRATAARIRLRASCEREEKQRNARGCLHVPQVLGCLLPNGSRLSCGALTEMRTNITPPLRAGAASFKRLLGAVLPYL